jgi:hypothetical protein
MDYGVGITTLFEALAVLSLLASIVAVGVVLQRLKGPDDRTLSR